MRARRGGHGREPTVGIHRGSIRPPHGRAIDVFHLLSPPLFTGSFRRRQSDGDVPVRCGSGAAPDVPAGPRNLAVFWPYMPLHPLQNMALNAYFSLFGIWPCFFSFRPYFRSYFALALCKCTILEQVPCFALLYVSVLCIFRNSSLVKVCANAQSLTRPCRPLNLPATSLSRRRDLGVDPVVPWTVCRPCHRGGGRCMDAARLRCMPVVLGTPYTSIHPLRRGA